MSDVQASLTLTLLCEDRPGVFRDIAAEAADCGANITFLQQSILDRGPNAGKAVIYMELEGIDDADALIDSFGKLETVTDVRIIRALGQIFGKRIIIIGGGAQVAQVALGAISEADRHNLRGEHISVDTIPLVGEYELAEAIYATAGLHRVGILVLAGALMGGKVCDAVDHLRQQGVPVISLNMAGGVPEHADIVVSDPVQAGTFAVMHVARTAKFDISQLKQRRY